jgi:hypothetical protein
MVLIALLSSFHVARLVMLTVKPLHLIEQVLPARCWFSQLTTRDPDTRGLCLIYGNWGNTERMRRLKMTIFKNVGNSAPIHMLSQKTRKLRL